MSRPQIDVVLAGTRGFANALLGPIAARFGTQPKVASDPLHALVECRVPGLVIVEFLGEDTLSAIKDLVLEGDGLMVVAAVPAAHAAADVPLRALGVDAVRWDGTPELVLRAVDRQLALAPPATQQAAPAVARAPARDEGMGALFDDLDPDLLAAVESLGDHDFEFAQPIDTEPVRRAAVMRVRVAVALSSAPGAGGAVDAGALSTFLADIDALLSDVNALAAGAPADVQASLEAMRNALVKEAIDFSEAVQQARPTEAIPQPARVVRGPVAADGGSRLNRGGARRNPGA